MKTKEDTIKIIESSDGTKQWYKEGKCHREDGPAIEWAGGAKEWYIGGKRHRIDGPAFENPDGTKEWWVGGKEYSDTIYVRNKIFLGKEKGKFGIEWLKFLTETGIEEYPLIPGMNYEFVQRYDLQSFLTTQENVLK